MASREEEEREDEKYRKMYRKQARKNFAEAIENDTLRIYEAAPVDGTGVGAWVQAWVWVKNLKKEP